MAWVRVPRGQNFDGVFQGFKYEGSPNDYIRDIRLRARKQRVAPPDVDTNPNTNIRVKQHNISDLIERLATTNL